MNGLSDKSRFMEMAVFAKSSVKKRIPSALHIDDSARLQTVFSDEESILLKILRSFFERTGVPVLVNTSLNLKGEPIVETPEDALRCMLFSDLDACLIEGNLFVPQSRNWSPLGMTPNLAGHLSYRGDLITFIRQTRWGPDERSFSPDSERAKVLEYAKTAENAGQLVDFIFSIMPWYQGFKPQHVLAIECRQGWISLFPPPRTGRRIL